jgi:hypothetical protein
MSTQTVLDFEKSGEARDAGIQKAGDAANDAWKTLALQWVIWLASNRPTFTSDDIWACGVPKPREPRALGAVFREASKMGMIEPVGYQQTAQVSRHRAPIRVWRRKV